MTMAIGSSVIARVPSRASPGSAAIVDRAPAPPKTSSKASAHHRLRRDRRTAGSIASIGSLASTFMGSLLRKCLSMEASVTDKSQKETYELQKTAYRRRYRTKKILPANNGGEDVSAVGRISA